jgi:Na+-transporting NADH:ubiquinone oxidoreductase subunit B
MPKLRRFLDRLEPVFSKGGRFERFHAVFEMFDTLLYSPPDVARGSPHVRDALDLKRVIIISPATAHAASAVMTMPTDIVA